MSVPVGLLGHSPLKLKKLRYIVFGFLLFDVVYGAALCIFVAQFVQIISNFGAFWLVYVVSTIVAMYAACGNREWLFYPVLVFVVPFVFGTLLVMMAVIAQLGICFAMNGNVRMPSPFLECAQSMDLQTRLSFLAILMFSTFILVEKVLEFVAIRRLMRLVREEKATDGRVGLVGRSFSNLGTNVFNKNARIQGEPSGVVVREVRDSDDDLVVYRNSTASVEPETLPVPKQTPPPLTPPPAYEPKENKVESLDTPTDSINELPLNSKSKRTIE
ncbi:unnamed protein product [Bursaphelenchus xylophilus]|uniref:(pine wood nematode) hypothetical protein n=1 Tax=Bursaphelenchus xylophilus TaxID=6326 RepID=A0A1I7SB20_BURXY|nr:unnamed protein product [Bursaphelenchus xylophilus]CAG9131698.1 unnamed protein product [Bursaphelenchus xylophilus]